jgi:low affinity Fe/Cu permease
VLWRAPSPISVTTIAPGTNRKVARYGWVIQAIRQLLTRLGVLTAHPAAFVIVFVYAGVWLILDRESLEWHSVATLATWLMTLLIQRAEHRDTQAIHAKLDELLRAETRARDELVKLDEKEAEEIEELREGAGAKPA